VDAKELVRLIDQQGVKIGGQFRGVRQPQFLFDRRGDVLERGTVPLGANEVLGDLPGVTDVRVGQRLLATAEQGRLAEAGELAAFAGVTGNLTARSRPPRGSGRLCLL